MAAYERMLQRLRSGAIVVLDGPTGTELQKRGAPMDPGAWCGPATLGNDRLLTEIHADYIAAGAEIVTANTFAASRLMLADAGLADRSAEIVARAVAAARLAAEGHPDVVVAGSLSHMVPVKPGTDALDPARVPPDEVVAAAIGDVAEGLKAGGVDLIILEMMYHPGRTRLALAAALATGLPVWFGLSARRGADGAVLGFDRNQDIPIDTIASLIPAEGVDVAGVMHTPSDLVGDALDAVRTRFAGPLMAYPDSGYFVMPDWRFVDIISPGAYADFGRGWVKRGVQVLGGCCGLGIEHVRAAAGVRDGLTDSRRVWTRRTDHDGDCIH
jgi:homocysteine S-methyltransferase